MTRPKVRPHTRVRCNPEKGLHKLGCQGHERRHSRRSRAEAAKEREARRRAERRSLGQLQRYRKHNALGPLEWPDEKSVAEAVETCQSSTAERRLGPLSSPTGGPCRACGQTHIDWERPEGTGYCHGYRQRWEHYHPTHDAMMACTVAA